MLLVVHVPGLTGGTGGDVRFDLDTNLKGDIIAGYALPKSPPPNTSPAAKTTKATPRAPAPARSSTAEPALEHHGPARAPHARPRLLLRRRGRLVPRVRADSASAARRPLPGAPRAAAAAGGRRRGAGPRAAPSACVTTSTAAAPKTVTAAPTTFLAARGAALPSPAAGGGRPPRSPSRRASRRTARRRLGGGPPTSCRGRPLWRRRRRRRERARRRLAPSAAAPPRRSASRGRATTRTTRRRARRRRPTRSRSSGVGAAAAVAATAASGRRAEDSPADGRARRSPPTPRTAMPQKDLVFVRKGGGLLHAAPATLPATACPAGRRRRPSRRRRRPPRRPRSARRDGGDGGGDDGRRPSRRATFCESRSYALYSTHRLHNLTRRGRATRARRRGDPRCTPHHPSRCTLPTPRRISRTAARRRRSRARRARTGLSARRGGVSCCSLEGLGLLHRDFAPAPRRGLLLEAHALGHDQGDVADGRPARTSPGRRAAGSRALRSRLSCTRQTWRRSETSSAGDPTARRAGHAPTARATPEDEAGFADLRREAQPAPRRGGGGGAARADHLAGEEQLRVHHPRVRCRGEVEVEVEGGGGGGTARTAAPRSPGKRKL